MKWMATIVLAALAACTPAAPTRTPEEAVAYARSLKPADSRLAGLYGQSCATCHLSVDAGAPLVGDRTAWDPRWKKGMPALVASTVAGLGGMPAGGQCFSCTPQDYEALIRFMAGRET